MIESIVTVIIVILGVVISVGLHEFGHLVPAKIFKAPVSEYFIGYGPKIWGKKIGETEYGFRWIPLGGYTKILGMFPPKNPDTKHYNKFGQLWNKLFGKTIDDIRKEAGDGIDDSNRERAFYHLTAGKKIIVMMGGTLTNFFLGVICFLIAFSGIGTMSAVNKVGAFSDGSPAQSAGIEVGDEIVQINDVNIRSFQDVINTMQSVKSPDVIIKVSHSGAIKEYSIKASLGEDNHYKLGISAATQKVKLSPFESIGVGLQTTTMTAQAILSVPAQLFGTVKGFISPNSSDQRSLVSLVGVGQIAIASEKSAPSLSDKIGSILLLLGSLNIALFVFNLVPLLPFDGGHTVNALYEGLNRLIAKLKGKPRPHPSDLSRSMPIAYLVWGLLLLMAVILVLADIFHPII